MVQGNRNIPGKYTSRNGCIISEAPSWAFTICWLSTVIRTRGGKYSSIALLSVPTLLYICALHLQTTMFNTNFTFVAMGQVHFKTDDVHKMTRQQPHLLKSTMLSFYYQAKFFRQFWWDMRTYWVSLQQTSKVTYIQTLLFHLFISEYSHSISSILPRHRRLDPAAAGDWLLWEGEPLRPPGHHRAGHCGHGQVGAQYNIN